MEEKYLSALLTIKDDVGTTKQGVKDLKDDMKDVKARLGQTVTKIECERTHNPIRSDESGPFPLLPPTLPMEDRWWDRTRVKVAVVVGILTIVGSIGFCFLWMTKTYAQFQDTFSAVKKQNGVDTKNQRIVNDEIKAALKDALKEIKRNGGPQ